ncbi:hypothetical protein [Streptomyces sp. MS2.AVA.5]|uniref:Uncharacterized protein n=1 Tax=Streptomyces achmelvichensis TaxID=3134111 RepID=A0ACC6PLS5_9ACTN
MAGFLARITSPLRRIEADPDDLVLEAYELLRAADRHTGLWPAITALSSQADAKIALATYLRKHRDS